MITWAKRFDLFHSRGSPPHWGMPVFQDTCQSPWCYAEPSHVGL